MATRQASLGQGGFTGAYEEPAQLANYLIFLYPVPLYLYTYYKNKIYLVAAGAIIVCFSLTVTRSALIIFALNLLYLLIVFIINSKKIHLFFIVLLIAGILGFIGKQIIDIRQHSNKNAVEMHVSFFNTSFKLVGASLNRYYLSIIGINLIDIKTFIIGRGALNEISFWKEIQDPMIKYYKPVSSVGNGFITIILYFGIIPLLLGLFYILKYFLVSWQIKKRNASFVFIDLIVHNIILALFLAHGGYVAYGFLSYFPTWDDTELFYTVFNAGPKHLANNINSILVVLFFTSAYSFAKKVKNFQDN